MGMEGGEGGGREAASLQEGGRQERWKQTRVAGLGEAGHTRPLRAEASAELSVGRLPSREEDACPWEWTARRGTWSKRHGWHFWLAGQGPLRPGALPPRLVQAGGPSGGWR